MIIEEFKEARDSAPTLFNICRKDCPEKINPCDNIYNSLTVTCSAGRGQGHRCDDAIFDAYILLFNDPQGLEAEKPVYEYVKRVNFNNASTGSTITQIIDLDVELITRANGGKITREDCCNLNLLLIEGPWPDPLTLPAELEDGIYLPPNLSETYTVPTRRASRVHANIVQTTVVRNIDGTVLIDPFTWQGLTPLDLCLGLEAPIQPPDDPITPVI